MSGNTNSITECLNQMIVMTKKNLAILKTLNDSFYTKKNHLAVIVGDEKFVIPSFISLESRIELLETNLQNIVDAPLTGEAFTYHDGTTQRIELSGYSTTPNHLELSPVSSFGTEVNNIFKDFMNPNPYVKIDISSIPNNIKHVNIRKVCIKNNDLKNALESISQNNTIDFADAERILYGYVENTDYICYDTIKRLPIRSGVAQGEYEILNIIDNYQDNNFDEFYELELDRDLVYYIKNGTIQKDIKVGDTLVTYNDKVIMEVMNVNPISRRITVKIMYGAYSDLQDRSSNNPALYKIKYYKSDQDLSASKYINVPLEEDEYIIVFVSPINDTTNTQAPWGTGLFIYVDGLSMPDPNNPDEMISFRDYYDQYVNNVGDALASITSMMDDDQQVSRLSQLEFNILKDLKPVIDTNIIKVTQINKHLNDAKAIKAIRNLYNQKSKYKSELEVVQRNIDKINKDLSELSFDDTTNSRTVYETQLDEYNTKKIELVNSIDSVMQEISVSANSSDVPIENAKYHIRGFIDTNIQKINDIIPSFVDVIKIDVEYRYKNKSSFTGNAETYHVGNDSYIYSDWNKMDSFYRKRIPEYTNGIYKYKWEDLNNNTNNPSFNQIDIPISQGELVDIRVRYIYNLGYPFAEMSSDWSEVYTQDFPQEFTQNVEILDIISENNDEIKSKHFERIIEQQGIKEHMSDQVQDQTDVYHHHANNIASGFLTDERRIVPVADKLFDFNMAIEDLKAEVFGSSSSNLIVTLSDTNNTIQLKPNIINAFHTNSYVNSVANESTFRIIKGSETPEDPLMAVSQMSINIYNNGAYQMKLHSLFPGAYDQDIIETMPAPINPGEFCGVNNVTMMLDNNDNNNLFMNQRYNQFMYFRTKLVDTTNPNNGNLYKQGATCLDAFTNNDDIMADGIPMNQLLGNNNNIVEIISDTDMSSLYDAMTSGIVATNEVKRIGFLYPYPGAVNNICIPSNQAYATLDPGESISMPINFLYWFRYNSNNPVFTNNQAMRNLTITRAIAFDIRTSLYHDPITFKIVVDASYDDSIGYNLKRANHVVAGLTPQRSTVAKVNITPQQIVKANMVNSTRTTRNLTGKK